MADLKEIEEQVKALTKQIADAVANFEKSNKTLQIQLTALEGQFNKLPSTGNSVAVVKPKKKKRQTPNKAFEVDGVKYKFTIPAFQHKVKGVMQLVVTEDALKDDALLASIVKNHPQFVEVQK